MNLYLLTQNKVSGHDTYDAVVVAAKSAKDARTIHPDDHEWDDGFYSQSWCKTPDDVDAQFLGRAAKGIKRGIILASFNAA